MSRAARNQIKGKLSIWDGHERMNRTNSDTLVLDIGANLGIHGLYAAKLGYRVWAVEPQEKNLIKVSI